MQISIQICNGLKIHCFMFAVHLKQIIQYLAVEGSKRERAAGKIEVIGIYGLWAPIENNDNDDEEEPVPPFAT